MFCRFITREGWEKWINVDATRQAWKVVEPVGASSLFDESPPLFCNVRERVFVREQWRSKPWPDETIFVEEKCPLPDAEIFSSERPSLHRERCFATVLKDIRHAIDSEDPPGPLGSAIGAMAKVERIEQLLRRLPAWFTE
jgi:hypothetical protein